VLYGFTASLSVRFCEGHSSALLKHGIETVVVSSPGSELVEIARRERLRTFPVAMHREIAPLADLVSLCKLWRVLQRVLPSISNFGTPKAGLLGGIAAKVAGVPCRIYTMHGLRLETATGVKRRLLLATERIACRCAHRVVCVSPSLRARAIELGLTTPEQSLVLSQGTCNGVDVEHYLAAANNQSAAASLRQSLLLPDEVPVVGFVGRFTRDKGIVELLEAFDRLRAEIPNLYLLLVGDFEDGDPVPLATRMRIEQDAQIINAGFVNDTAPYYPLMDVLALPTYREGFPGVPLEAGVAGKPVVATRATGAVDSVIDEVTGLLVPVGDSAALAAALERLLKDPTLRQEMGTAAQERVMRDFRQRDVIDALIKEYCNLLSSTHEGSRRVTSQRGWRLRVKRLGDVSLAFCGIVVLSPVMLLVTLLIALTMGRPILFRQRRPGKDNQPFTLLKFRTMGCETDAQRNPLPDNQRLTRLGRLLRATSADELPQLWNVLRGDLSLVGPRPLLMQYQARYTPEQMRRHEVMPGITGWAQVNGRNALSWPEKFALDVWYVDHWSLGLDMRIILKTVGKVFRRDGISRAGHVTMPEFQGNEDSLANPVRIQAAHGRE